MTGSYRVLLATRRSGAVDIRATVSCKCGNANTLETLHLENQIPLILRAAYSARLDTWSSRKMCKNMYALPCIAVTLTTGYHYTHDRLKNYLFQLSHAIPFVPTSSSSGLSSRCNTDNCTSNDTRFTCCLTFLRISR